MFQSGYWFAWYPVRTTKGRDAWLETVSRDRIRIQNGTGAWRYYAAH